jgi:hypothetical protein
MSGLNALKFTTGKRQQGNSPQQARRQKLSVKLEEQIKLAKAEQSGTEYAPTKIRTVKDEATGESRKVQVPKKLKPWWWTDDKGKLCITVRYGARTLEIMDGKNAIEADNIADVITSLQVIRSAVDAGELDKRIEAVTAKIKDGMRDVPPAPVQTSTAPEKRSILGLSNRKSN